MNKLSLFIDFFRKDIWKKQKKNRSFKNLFYKLLRIVISSAQGFIETKGFDKASTLTFYSLLSIVPLVAIGFGIAQTLGFKDNFVEQVKLQLQSQPEIAQKIIEFSNSTIQTTRGGIIAGFGIIVLLWTVLRMIGNIESSFDEIWQIKTPRTLWMQAKSYLPLILLFPIFLVSSNALIIYLTTKALLASQSIEFLTIFSSFLRFLFDLFPYLLSWGILSFLYIYLPNTKVNWKSGMIAAVTTGIIYMLWQWIYINFQANALGYGTIYGSFAAFPLFLIWLNYSWIIIIFGAELSYHIQKEATIVD